LIGQAIRGLGHELGAIDAELGVAFDELCDVWDRPVIDAGSVAEMKHFSGLFGRETAYVSLVIDAGDVIRPRDGGGAASPDV
jgi:hypothetical protein